MLTLGDAGEARIAMEPKTLKGSPFTILLGFAAVPIIALGVPRDLKILFATTFSAHPLLYAWHLIIDVGIDVGFLCAALVPAIYAAKRWQRTAVITDAGIESSASSGPREILRWPEVAELRRVGFFGGIDVIDTNGEARIRLPFSSESFQELAQAVGEKLGGVDDGVALPVVFSPKPDSGMQAVFYFGAGICLFIAWAPLLEGRHLVAALAIIFLALFAAVPQLLRGMRVEIDSDEVKIRRPLQATQTRRFAEMSKVELEAIAGFLYVRLQSSGDRSFSVAGRNTIRIYRALITAWTRWKQNQAPGSAT